MKKPLIEDMMQSLYYLYNKGFILKTNIDLIFEDDYNVTEIIIKEGKFSCIQGNIKTTINI